MTEESEHSVLLDASFPEGLERELLARVRYVSPNIKGARIGGDDRDRVLFALAPVEGENPVLVIEQLRELTAELTRGYRPHVPTVLSRREWTNRSAPPNPHEALIAAGELIPYGPGRLGLGPRTTALMEEIDRLVVDLAEEPKPAAYHFPALVGSDVLLKAEYHRSFPHLLTLASHVREEMEALRDFRNRPQGKELGDVRDLLAPPACGLSPTVCYHAYDMWARTLHDSPEVLTARGKCFRYESTSLVGLERLWDFTMREVVFLGTPETIVARRDGILQQWVQLLDALDLSYEISSATDPFFVDEFAMQAIYQQAFESKFEILADLPYAGKKLAIGSINFHRDHFTKSFGIRSSNTAILHTACVGWGLERITLAFLAQHGLNRADWPPRFRKIGSSQGESL